MATIKQKRLAKLVVEHAADPDITKGQLAEMGGYGVDVQETPSKVFESKGFLEELDALGLTDSLLTTSLVADIKKKKGNRARELELGFKVRGRLKETPPPYGGTTNNIIIYTDAQLRRAASRFLQANRPGEETPR